MAVTKQSIIQALQGVQDPELHRDIVSLGWIKTVTWCDGSASVELRVPRGAAGARDDLKSRIRAAIRGLGPEVVDLNVTVSVDLAPSDAASPAGTPPPPPSGQAQNPQSAARANNPLPGVKHIIAVGAGKGGVGKSTIAVNLAVGLARQGAFVGLLDADIYGPSLPTLLGLESLQPQVRGNTLLPFDVHGVRAITLGALVDEEKPLIWRGPMAHGAFRQLAVQTEWGNLDYLIIDLPPGTGDIPLTMAQMLPLTGAVVVCTPQKVAQDDARRAVRMFQQLGIDVLGIVENMSYFVGDDGKEYDIFGKGGAEMMAQQMGMPFLGSVPISMPLRRNSDAGTPALNFEDDSPLSRDLESLVRKIAGQVKVHELSGDPGPTLTVR